MERKLITTIVPPDRKPGDQRAVELWQESDGSITVRSLNHKGDPVQNVGLSPPPPPPSNFYSVTFKLEAEVTLLFRAESSKQIRDYVRSQACIVADPVAAALEKAITEDPEAHMPDVNSYQLENVERDLYGADYLVDIDLTKKEEAP